MLNKVYFTFPATALARSVFSFSQRSMTKVVAFFEQDFCLIHGHVSVIEVIILNLVTAFAIIFGWTSEVYKLRC